MRIPVVFLCLAVTQVWGQSERESPPWNCRDLTPLERDIPKATTSSPYHIEIGGNPTHVVAGQRILGE